MSDKRKVTTDALETLGNIIEGGGRDAIHLAVEPVIAGMDLAPGQDIGIRNGEAFKYMVNEKSPVKLVGIVDPFLKEKVKKGQMFWLVVYPRQITSLRHVWEHPDFADIAAPKVDEKELNEKERSELWIRNFAAKVGLRYDVLIDGAKEWVITHDNKWGGEYLCFGGLLEGITVPDDFWDHYEIVTGEKVEQAHRGNFFSCSC